MRLMTKYPVLFLLALIIGSVSFPALGFCDGMHDFSENMGKGMSVLWVIPFVCMLLSIAIGPLAFPQFWHHHFGKVALFWGLAFLVPFAVLYTPSQALYEFLHAMIGEYIPFIVLLFALFTVAGGIRLKGNLVGTPLVNTAILLVGTALASWMGTTGAAMLLIRPLLRANAHRKYQVHSVVFFIFLVANIGGCLTPLGDPPLFLGFLQGVGFFWTLNHLLPLLLFCSAILLAVYFILDTILFIKEGKPRTLANNTGEKLGVEGLVNFPLLGCVVLSVLMSGVWKPEISFTLYEVGIDLQNLTRDVLLLCIAFASMKLTRSAIRERNDFNWGPIEEVAKLFFGIFLSMIPALAILKAGTDGALASIVAMVSNNGVPDNTMFYWLTGVLSSFLDNAPTYLVFFNTAGGISGYDASMFATVLQTEMAPTLLAISAGAVFMGANTYIGNAPNFMVRSIAEDMGVKMPSFFGYMVWSVGILVPVFILVNILFI